MRYVLSLVLLCGLIVRVYPQEGLSLDPPQDKIVAVVNNEIITQSDVEELMAAFYMQMVSEYSDEHAQKEMEKMRGAALERLIEDKLILQEARRQKIEITSQMIEEREVQIKSKFADEIEFQRSLVEQGKTLSDLKERIREQLMMSAAVNLNVRKNVTVSPVEITAYYQAHRDEFRESESVRVDSIFCDFHDKAKQALSALRQGRDFKDVEKEMSSGSSLGMVKKGELLPEIEEAIFSLAEGEVSDIVKAKAGFYIFRLVKKIPESELSLSELEGEIKAHLIKQKTETRFMEWLKGLRENAYVVVK